MGFKAYCYELIKVRFESLVCTLLNRIKLFLIVQILNLLCLICDCVERTLSKLGYAALVFPSRVLNRFRVFP
jgi:hypothetical protein